MSIFRIGPGRELRALSFITSSLGVRPTRGGHGRYASPKILLELFGREKAPEDSESASRAPTHIRFRRWAPSRQKHAVIHFLLLLSVAIQAQIPSGRHLSDSFRVAFPQVLFFSLTHDADGSCPAMPQRRRIGDYQCAVCSAIFAVMSRDFATSRSSRGRGGMGSRSGTTSPSTWDASGSTSGNAISPF